MKHIILTVAILIAGALSVFLLSGCGSDESKNSNSGSADKVSTKAQVTDVSLVSKVNDNMEIASITGTNSDGGIVWTIETDEYPATELASFSDIGIYKDQYYYVENGTVVSLDINTGSRKWENDEFGGSPARGCCLITDSGTVYLSGYYGPDFYAIDRDGKTLGRIGTVDERYYWPSEMHIDKNQLIITMDGSSSGEEGVVSVDLSNY